MPFMAYSFGTDSGESKCGKGTYGADHLGKRT